VVKVGIGIGAVIGIFVVAALGALTMWYLERRRRSQSTERQVQAAQTSKNPKIVQVEALPLDYYPVEADGARHPAELG
jgi:Flp pilus assembly protein TadB